MEIYHDFCYDSVKNKFTFREYYCISKGYFSRHILKYFVSNFFILSMAILYIIQSTFAASPSRKTISKQSTNNEVSEKIKDFTIPHSKIPSMNFFKAGNLIQITIIFCLYVSSSKKLNNIEFLEVGNCNWSR